MTAVAFFSAPLMASLLEVFLKELRIDDLVLDSDTIPGWFMAFAYFIYMLLVVFFFVDASDPQESSPSQTSLEPEVPEKMWSPGLMTCSWTDGRACCLFLAPPSQSYKRV